MTCWKRPIPALHSSSIFGYFNQSCVSFLPPSILVSCLSILAGHCFQPKPFLAVDSPSFLTEITAFIIKLWKTFISS
ncbi:hypothetical protein O6P43_017201 [Quillaja saponaria]|uniref:Uncharacterized protein n=1 Tax=Quillaja saponaria TaxID=32244 RepID=A0AAD7LPX0_QUISA|nr:hypothetical protein O6P43_017201 [Quillaja saponaria]